MATFTITVEGVSGPALLTKYDTANTTCASIFEIFITTSEGDSVNFTVTNGGYTDYNIQLDTGSGFTTISPTAFTVIHGGYSVLKISMLNTSIVETVNLLISGTSVISSVTQDITTFRDSTGSPC